MDALPPAAARTDQSDLAASGAFDTYLEVRLPNSDLPLAENDDRPGPPYTYNSSLIFSAPDDSTYVVRARALFEAAGDYILNVVAAPAAVTRDLVLGEPPVTARIDANDRRRDDRYYEDYRLPLRRGQIVQIDMEEIEQAEVGLVRLDPLLAIYGRDETTPLDMNDDRGDSFNSRLFFAAPADGNYIVRAQGLGGTIGGYRISARLLSAMPQPPQLVEGRATGIWVDGSLATLRNGESIRYAEYSFQGRQGESVTVNANSTPDPTLRLAGNDRHWFAERVGADKIAQLSARLPRTGTYIVRIEVGPPYEGSFTLTLSRAGEGQAREAPATTP